MLGVLQVVLGRHAITGGGGIARELDVFLRDMQGGPTDLHVAAVALEGAGQRIGTLAVTAAHALVLLSWSHRLVSSCTGMFA